jgi:hypothetical protein
MPWTRPPATRHCHALAAPVPMAVALVAAALSGAAPVPAAHASPPQADSWQVRATGSGERRRVESSSDLNAGKPERSAPLAARQIARHASGQAEIRLHAEPAVARVLAAQGVDYARELHKAADWLSRLPPPRQPAARIELTLVADRERTRMRRVHPGASTTVVDIAVPVLLGAGGNAPSAQVGQALAIALHEASHATAALMPARPNRADDEYRASLVESCYLVDTLRPGDTLRLRSGGAARGDEYFVSAASRKASADVVHDMARAAGGHEVAWHDTTALLGLKALCRIRLAMAAHGVDGGAGGD